MKKTIVTNIISGLSLIFLIVFGANYLIFKNTQPYENLIMQIVNNPVTKTDDIHFAMTGTKMLPCIVERAYAIAYDSSGRKVYLTDFTEQYIRNVSVGERVNNSWKMRKPEGLRPGVWRVDVIGDWTCRFWVFEETQTRTYDNILLIVE
jgi:hypothetical protein